MRVKLVGYVHHIRGNTITIKSYHVVEAGGKTRNEYSHISLPVQYLEDEYGTNPDRSLIDFAVEFIGKYVVAQVENGHIIMLAQASKQESKQLREG